MSGDEADPGAAYEALDGVFLQEAPSPPPEVLATLETEEALFRLYWKTLPDKALARRTWPKEIQYFCRERGLGPEIMEALTRRCQDLRETRPSP